MNRFNTVKSGSTFKSSEAPREAHPFPLRSDEANPEPGQVRPGPSLGHLIAGGIRLCPAVSEAPVEADR